MKILNKSLLAFGLVLWSSASLLAATSTWSGASDSLFSNPANWSAAPSTGDALVFPAATSYTVDFTGVSPNNGPILFNASSDYLFTPAGQTLTLSGDITQSGSGAVVSDISLDLGGATRTFGGAGSGIVRLNGTISGATGNGINITGGAYALARPTYIGNLFDGGVNVTGGTLKVISLAGGGNLIYQSMNDAVGAGNVTINGGSVELISEDPTALIQVYRTNTFGASGGSLVYSNYNYQIANNNANASVINGPATIIAYPARMPRPDPTGNDGDNLAGACQLQNLTGSGQVTLVLRNGAAGRFQQQVVGNFAGSAIIDGQPGGDITADQSPTAPNGGTNIVYMSLNNTSNPYIIAGGISFRNYCQLYFTHSNPRPLASDVTVLPNSGFAVQGRPNSGSARPFIFGNDATTKITIQDTGLAQMDLQVSRWVNPLGSVTINSASYINAGGTLRFTRTYNDGTGWNVGNIAANGPVTGQGSAAKDSVLDLLLDGGSGGNNGVTFGGGANLIVNGTGTGGLRIQATNAAALANLLTGARLNALTGSGGTLTLALVNNDSFTVTDGPSSASSVALGVDSQGGSAPTYVLGAASTLANFSGLVVKGGTVSVPAASTVTLGTLDVAGNATLQMGASGTLQFAASSGAAWTAGKTLSIAGWNGSAAGGGPDRIIVGTGPTGLTAGQLAQIKWISPNGGGDVVGAKILTTGEIVPAVTTMITSPAKVGADYVFNVVPGLPGQTSVIQHATNLVAPIFWENVQTNTGAFTYTNTFPLPAYFRVVVQ